MIDPKQLRKDLGRIGYILGGFEIREEIPPGVCVGKFTNTSRAEADWAFEIALKAQGSEADRTEFEEVAKGRKHSGINE